MVCPHSSKNQGQSLVEILMAIGLSSILMPAVLLGFLSSREGKVEQNQRLTAITLVKEGTEAVRNVREVSWDKIVVNGTFHPAVADSIWILSPGEEEIGDFKRAIVIADALRDENGQLVEEGGEVDPSTKKITVRVSWNTILPVAVADTIYLTRYLDNAKFVETTQAQFDLGVRRNTVVTNVAGGEVQLGAGGRADWCEPALSIPAVNLPKQGVANAVSAIEGRVFAGTGDNASGVSFANVEVSNDYPPQAKVSGTFDGYKTNDVFGEKDYAYLATDNNAKEIVIINLTTSPYLEAGYFDAPGPTDAESVFISGNTGYMIAGDKFYNFDLSSKSGSREEVDPDGVTLAGTGKKIVVLGTYAYVAVDATSTQLQIIDLSSPANLAVVGSAQVDGAGGRYLYVTDTRVYLATAASEDKSELFIIDITTKNGNRPVVGSYNTAGMDPRGVTVVPGNHVIVVGKGGSGVEEYQVVYTLDESHPTRCGKLSVDSGINGVASVLEADGDAYSYIITGDSDAELKIIEGGPGGKVGTSGTFDSQVIDLGSEVALNRFNALLTELPGTEIRFQVAGADAVNGSCDGAGFTYVGPDATADTYFDQGGSIPANNDGSGYENPARCFRYKVYFDSQNPGSTPVFSEIVVNYSP